MQHAPSIDGFKGGMGVDVRLFVFRFDKMIGGAIGDAGAINTNAVQGGS